MKLIIIVFLFCSKTLFSQQYVIVVDTITKEPLSYTNIKFKNNKGVYANKNGVFKLEQKIDLSISHLGYKHKIIRFNQIKDTIFLTPINEELNEVLVINREKEILKKIKFQKGTNFFGSYLLSSENEIISSIIPNQKIRGYYIDKMIVSFEKLKWHKEKDSLKEQLSVIKINIYELMNNKPNKLLFSSNPIKMNAYNKDKIELKLENESLIFNKEGLGFGIEYLGNINSNGDFFKTSRLYLRPTLDKNKSKYYKAKTFIRHTLSNNEYFTPLNDTINTYLPKGIKSNFDRNLAISFELSK